MPQTSRHHALKFLAKSINGHSEPLLLARGFNRELLAGLLRDGLATASKECAGRIQPVEVTRIKITAAGVVALARR
jgi:hypothetical protein